jgi:hypothetical protein
MPSLEHRPPTLLRLSLALAACLIPALATEAGQARAEWSKPVLDALPPNGEIGDEEMETILLDGKLLGWRELGTGVTHPLLLRLEGGGRTLEALYKTVDIEQEGVSQDEEGETTPVYFVDRHRHERAAYLLDRRLGLMMVPVAVNREVDGKEGAVVHWIQDTITEQERRDRDLPLPPGLLVQRDIMFVFDALTYNVDRHLENCLLDLEAERLYLIDHSRAFDLTPGLPEGFRELRLSLPRELVTRLGGLTEKDLRRLLRGLVSRRRIQVLLDRRDRILAKIEEDRQRYGESGAFLEEGARPAPRPAPGPMRPPGPEGDPP